MRALTEFRSLIGLIRVAVDRYLDTPLNPSPEAWHPAGSPRQIGAAEVQYLRARDGHEGAHEVDCGGPYRVRLLPDGTSGQMRSRALSCALAEPQWNHTPEDRLALLVGRLWVGGHREIEVIPRGERGGH